MPDQNPPATPEAMPRVEAEILLDRMNAVENRLGDRIDKITFRALVGAWISEHLFAVSLGSVLTVLSFVGTLVMGTLWVDGNYVDAAELKQSTEQIQRGLNNLEQRGRIDSLEMRKWYLEQRLEDYEAKPRRTPEDNAKIERMKRDIRALDRKINDAENKIVQ